MAKKLFVQLQKPFVELEVFGETVDGEKSTIKVGFRSFSLKDAQIKLGEYSVSAEKSDINSIDEFIKSLILYIKDAVIEVRDEDTFDLVETIKIADTRKAEANEFWETAEECFNIVVDSYLNSGSWKTSLTNKAFQALTNMRQEEEAIKN